MSLVTLNSDRHGTYIASSADMSTFLQQHFGDINAGPYTLAKYAAGICGYKDSEFPFLGDDEVTIVAAIIDSGNCTLDGYRRFCAEVEN